MKNRKIFKVLSIAFMFLAFGMLGINVNNVNSQIFGVSASSTTSETRILASSHEEVTLSEPLNSCIRKILQVEDSKKLYSDSFLTSDIFNPDPETSPDKTAKTVLNLSDSGVTDILELAKFSFPETLTTIDLTHNGITEDNLPKILDFLNLNENDVVPGSSEDDENSFTSKSSFQSIINLVILNDNEIDLNAVSTMQSSPLNNTKLFFGVQDLSKAKVGLVKSGTLNLQYYIRQSDVYSASSNPSGKFILDFTHEFSTNPSREIKFNYGQVGNLLEDINLGSGVASNFGKFTIALYGNDESLQYYSSQAIFRYFDIKIKDDFWVERKAMLNLKITDGVVSSSSEVELFDGSTTNHKLKVSYNNYSTNIATREGENEYKNYVTLNISDIESGSTLSVPLEFMVKDTITPVITLKGSATMQCSRNRTFVDPGATAYDPAFEGATSGDPITVYVSGIVDVQKLNTYTLTYTASDGFNTATLQRTVVVVETAFDKVNFSCDFSGDIFVGDEIKISVTPDSSIDLDSYSNISYDWYVNDEFYKTTSADKNGKANISYSAENYGSLKIYVLVSATIRASHTKVQLYSDNLLLDVSMPISHNDTLILAVGCAVLIIIIVIMIVTIAKITKSKKSVSQKSKSQKSKSSKNSHDSGEIKSDNEIKVIKDFNGDKSNYEPPKQPQQSSNQNSVNSSPQSQPKTQNQPQPQPQRQNPSNNSGTPIARIQPIKKPVNQNAIKPTDVNPFAINNNKNNNNKK